MNRKVHANLKFSKVHAYFVVGDGFCKALAVEMKVNGAQFVEQLLRLPTVLVGIAHLQTSM